MILYRIFLYCLLNTYRQSQDGLSIVTNRKNKQESLCSSLSSNNVISNSLGSRLLIPRKSNTTGCHIKI